jgi:ABC-type Mn2+/Zn2+ transport system ATPase subunit
VADLLDFWQLRKDAQRSFHLLSGGQKTRALVARAIAATPRILFLDEPLASLDSCCQRQLMESLHEMAHTKGMCVVMIDHHFGQYENLLSGKITFARGHDVETCTVHFESLRPQCGHRGAE